MEIYLDNAATTAVCKESADAAYHAITVEYGNPSSTHTVGRRAKKLMDASRKEIADALYCKSTELVFTASGSESDNMAVLGAARLNKRVGKHIISSETEHSAVLRPLEILESEGFEVTRLKPDAQGEISIDDVRQALRPDTALVTLMYVNNETGAVTDIGAISKIIKKQNKSTLLHTDAVQAFMKIPFTAKSMGADLISVSGHKIHAPKGIGALYVREGLRLPPIIVGGAQEGERRAGTEAVPLISAFAAAVRAANADGKVFEKLTSLRAYAVARLSETLPELVFISDGAAHILPISMPGYPAEVLMNVLESRSVYVSRSSACKKGKRSHVLSAMNLRNELIDSALRIGFSRFNTEADIDALCEALLYATATLKSRN